MCRHRRYRCHHRCRTVDVELQLAVERSERTQLGGERPAEERVAKVNVNGQRSAQANLRRNRASKLSIAEVKVFLQRRE